MDDYVLKKIMDYATRELMDAYGYCGVAAGDTAAMLNSTDKNGNDIVIKIKVETDNE
jgi:hypothetical protein